ncbi:RNA polymerase sigma-70 factor [Sphingobacterium paucimobilis]|uniref:HTH luxR-type domain-containing protein n=1 Tax=Sphingobacterium paucimobilis HER1398 TaxID=1346330 RepID=U2HAD3_9SPHI|nr:RNA polymerase sigma-70 factor [Sphingobacterium paucimobilis]ERJ58696.1 hypothetical protein M472_07940 [Sphingobacterium paucimobilis HER1398]
MDANRVCAKMIEIGQESVFEAMYLRFYSPLCLFASKYVLDDGDAEDLVGSVFTKLWKDKAPFENFDHLRNFLYRSTYNACLNHLRRSQRNLLLKKRFAEDLSEVGEDYWSGVIRAELITKIFEAIDQLPQHYAQVLRLAFAEELKNEEIADRLDLSIQTVKNYKSRGLEIIRKRISPMAFLLLITMMS